MCAARPRLLCAGGVHTLALVDKLPDQDDEDE